MIELIKKEPQLELTAALGAGYEKGYNAGKEEGTKEGYTDGYNEGSAAGYEQGKNDGAEESYSAGYDKGYADGAAKYEIDYTNVLPTATEILSEQVYNGIGYKDNWRLDKSGGYAQSGKVSTGLVSYIVPNSGLPPIIYVSGAITLDGVIAQVWKANKAYVTELYGLAAYYTVTKIKDGYYKLEPIKNANGRSPLVDNCGVGISYLSFVFSGSGESLVITLDEPIAGAVENAYNEGWQAQYDAFWDTYQKNGNRSSYSYAFANDGWDNTTFKPKYDIKPTGSCACMFQNSSIRNFDECGVAIDFSKCTSFNNLFYYSWDLRELPTINCSNCTTLSGVFGQCGALKKIVCFKIRQDGTNIFNSCFTGAKKLEEITIDGVIGTSFNIDATPVLTSASVQSIINALKNLTGSTSQTLALHADVKAKLTDAQKAQIAAKNWTLA